MADSPAEARAADAAVAPPASSLPVIDDDDYVRVINSNGFPWPAGILPCLYSACKGSLDLRHFLLCTIIYACCDMQYMTGSVFCCVITYRMTFQTALYVFYAAARGGTGFAHMLLFMCLACRLPCLQSDDMMQVDGPESQGADEEGLPKFGSSTCEHCCVLRAGGACSAQCIHLVVIRLALFPQMNALSVAWLTVVSWLL